MQLNHSFTVPAGVEEAWEVLRDIQRVAPCMPGATITEVDGDEFAGRVKVKVGPMQLTYKGTAAFVDVDEANHRAVLEAKGQETRGSGTAAATVTAELTERPEHTEVTVFTDLAVTGRPAQFGRGVMLEVGDKLLTQFADCLAEKLAGAPEPSETIPEPAPVTAGEAGDAGVDMTAEPSVVPAAARMIHGEFDEDADDVAAINLFDVAGGSIAKRVLPVLGVLVVVWLLVRLSRRNR